jgi:hypothetical protein
MRFLLVAALLLFSASHATSEENQRQSVEQAEKSNAEDKPTGAFEIAGKPLPFWFAPQTQTIQIVSEKKAEGTCDSPEHQTLREFFSFGWCELRTYPEAITAGATLVLALVTFVLAISTHTAARAANTAAEHIPRAERAYMFFGPGNIAIGGNFKDGKFTVVRMNVTHFGQTPGFFKRIGYKFSLDEPSGDKPTYSDCYIWKGAEVVLKQENPFDIPVPAQSNCLESHYFFGFMEYSDIFGEGHTSRVCIKIHPTIGKWEIAGSPAWNSWD